MDPVSLITGALLAGLKDVAPQAVKDAYTGLNIPHHQTLQSQRKSGRRSSDN